MSSSRRISIATISRPSVRAAARTSRTSEAVAGLAALNTTATRLKPGTISRNRSSLLPPNSEACCVRPVMLIAREAPTSAERKVAVVDDEGREVGTVPVQDDKKYSFPKRIKKAPVALRAGAFRVGVCSALSEGDLCFLQGGNAV